MNSMFARETTGMWDHETVTKPEEYSSPEQTGAADKTSNTQMLEDVEEPMPTERISQSEETDILLLSRDEEVEVLRSLSILNPEEMVQSWSRTRESWASRRRSMEKLRCL